MSDKASERQLAEQLKGVPLFSNTSARQRKALAKLGKIMTWREGTEGVKEGAKGAAFFLILDGTVDVTRDGKSIARLGAGDFVGEIALLTKQPRTATVVATSDTSVFALARTGLASAMKVDPQLGLALLEAMAERQQGLG